jgi:hypothetical protein
MVSYDESRRVTGGEGETWEDGKTIWKRASGVIREISTDADKTYFIVFSNYLVYLDKPEKVGIYELIIMCSDTYHDMNIDHGDAYAEGRIVIGGYY